MSRTRFKEIKGFAQGRSGCSRLRTPPCMILKEICIPFSGTSVPSVGFTIQKDNWAIEAAVLCSAVSRTQRFLLLSRSLATALTPSHWVDNLHSHSQCFQKKKQCMLTLPDYCLVPRQGTLNRTLISASDASFTSGHLDTCGPLATSWPLVQEKRASNLMTSHLGELTLPITNHI